MANEIKNYKPNLKYYHILMLGCLLSSLIILNSNHINNQRNNEKFNKEKSKIFEEIISKRKLETSDQTDTDKVCEKGSKELVNYYKTGNLEEIDLKNEGIKCEENGKPYFEALKNIIKATIESGEEESESTDENNNLINGLRNLDLSISDMQDDFITYGKHLLPIIIFLVIGIFSLPGWLVCCFCCCCNCCCCCCCKKPGCKIPCFIFTYVFYGLSIAICLYGVTQSNSIYVGLANTECSILKFFEEVLVGEIKEELPRWAGFEGINEILNDIYNEIYNLKSGTMNNLNQAINLIEANKETFLRAMNESGDKFFADDNRNHYIDKYTVDYSNFDDYPSRNLNHKYVLDLIKMFGKKKRNEKGFEPPNSILYIWEKEYSLVSENADSYISQAQESFESMIDSNSGDILQNLDDGKTILEDLKGIFNDINSGISGNIVDYSELIDNYGRLGFKLIFGVLGLMNIALAVFVLFICFFSDKICANCCCCRCLFKFMTHLFWNLLSLLMFITFLLGFIFTLIGIIGGDAMSLISFLVSEDNLGKNGVGGENILVEEIGAAKNYLDRCINGDGKIEEELGLNLIQIDSFDQVNDVEDKINETKTEFEQKKTFVAYTIYKEQLEQRYNLTAGQIMLVEEQAEFDTEFNAEKISEENKDNYLVFKAELELMNEGISQTIHRNERWDIRARNTENICSNGADNSYSGNIVFYPLTCKPLDRDWIKDLGTTPTQPNDKIIRYEAQIITDTLTLIEHAKTETLENGGYLALINSLKDKYEKYLDQYIITLEDFGKIINKITGKLKQYIKKDEGVFSFIRCNFIGTNLKIILKYLKSALGNDIRTIGICLTVVGCSLALSISSTILLIVIINIDLDKSKKEIKQEEQNQFNLDQKERVIQYQD